MDKLGFRVKVFGFGVKGSADFGRSLFIFIPVMFMFHKMVVVVAVMICLLLLPALYVFFPFLWLVLSPIYPEP